MCPGLNEAFFFRLPGLAFLVAYHVFQVFREKEKNMLKKQLALLFALVFTIPLATAVFAQPVPAQEKEARFEGKVTRSNKEKSTLTVHAVGGPEERLVQYDSSTKWVSQYHGDKKVKDIDASEVKDGDRVICKGAWDGSVFHATLISKRLSHSE
jgi:hypothetical protein